MGWIGRVEKLEKLDELTAAMAILDQGVNLTGQCCHVLQPLVPKLLIHI
jgi:hypothetical protein